jgi:hypothetical protein
LGKRRQGGLSEKNWQLIDERKKMGVSVLQQQVPDRLVFQNEQYRALDKAVKKSARTDKRNFLERKAMEAEEAAKRGDSRTVYRITNDIIRKRLTNRDGPVSDLSGVLVKEQSAVN